MKIYNNAIIGTASEVLRSVGIDIEDNKDNDTYLWVDRKGDDNLANFAQAFTTPQVDTTHEVDGYYFSFPKGEGIDFAFVDYIQSITDIKFNKYYLTHNAKLLASHIIDTHPDVIWMTSSDDELILTQEESDWEELASYLYDDGDCATLEIINNFDNGIAKLMERYAKDGCIVIQSRLRDEWDKTMIFAIRKEDL